MKIATWCDSRLRVLWAGLVLAPHGFRRAKVKVDSLQPTLQRAQKTLDGLGPGSVILDRYGDAWQSARGYGPLGGMHATGYWYRAYGDSSEVSSFELAQRGPVAILESVDRARLFAATLKARQLADFIRPTRDADIAVEIDYLCDAAMTLQAQAERAHVAQNGEQP